MNSSERGQIEADRLEAGRKEAIEHGHEGLTMEATAALYGRDASAVRHAALNHEAEAVRFTITTGGRDLKMIGKDWADAYWGGCGDTEPVPDSAYATPESDRGLPLTIAPGTVGTSGGRPGAPAGRSTR